MRDARQFRAMARHVLMNRYWWAVLATLIFGLLNGGCAALVFFSELDELEDLIEEGLRIAPQYAGMAPAILSLAGLFGLLLGLAFLFVGAAVELGYNRYLIAQYRAAGAPGLETLFSRFGIFWRAVGLRLLMLLKTLLWSLLLVVPGIVAAYRYALAPYLLAEDPSLAPFEAIEQSKALMQGHKARLFRLHLSFAGWYLLLALCAGIGAPLINAYAGTAVTGFYMERTGQLRPAAQAAAPAPGAPAQTAAEQTETEWI
ncbi:MAG: DUF975 family protein [Clostridia bacterium]|nr:DUF975 family protein [Clostridia bacterium]